ncbi:MAG: Bifunctional uridylyltransferase/uridylyl-removing enzyme [candidate division BRC1 bacterium ADurb.BinA364]|nr:MAG: Bifunctional uridylyltransferase/uridylyl-removing enzyme [candidate division BRC1 bacterium ADurb.BinA364]
MLDLCAARIQDTRETIARENASIPNGLLSAIRLAGANDRAMKDICAWSLKVSAEMKAAGEPMAMAALGGYGRRQLNLFSDIDIVFLLPSAHPELAELQIRLALYAIFDLRLKTEIGYGAKSSEQACEAVGVDLDTTTAFIDCRFLAGNRPLYDRMRERVGKRLRGEKRRWLIKELLGKREERLSRHGSSVYMLEPNIKESAGGLRDLHTISWLSYLLLGDTRLRALHAERIWTASDLRAARESRAFLLWARNELHALEGRRIDQMRRPKQNDLARRLGYENSGGFLAEENFLRDYYKQARDIDDLANKVVGEIQRLDTGLFQGMVLRLRKRRIAPHIEAVGESAFLDDESKDWFKKAPSHIFQMAALLAEKGLRFSERAKSRLRLAVKRYDATYQSDPLNRDYFLRILRAPLGMTRILRQLYETGALTAFLPEWEHLFCLVRSDFYHSYTVDEHHFKCLEEAQKLMARPRDDPDPRVAGAASRIVRWDLVNLALLLHDVGKGLGGAHALRGAQIADRVAMRLKLGEDDRADLRFLVYSHLKMSHVAQRRDLMDDRVILDFAREIGTVDRLRMLFVHTVCDFRGVGPGAYTDWRAQLLGMLYDSAEAALKGRPLAHTEKPQILPALRQATLERLGPEADEAAMDAFLLSLPDRYFAEAATAADLREVARRAAKHFELIRKLTEQNRIEWELLDGDSGNYSELLIASHDVPGVFARICGALASKEINILSADVHSTTDGYAIDLLRVTDTGYKRLPAGFRLDRLKRILNDALISGADIDELVAKSRKRAAPLNHLKLHRPTRVDIDAEASDTDTVIDIFALDRTGLLYDIAKTLYERNLTINLAKISTASYQVVDSLYVTDTEGNKIYGASEIESLRKALIQAIDAEPEGKPQ